MTVFVAGESDVTVAVPVVARADHPARSTKRRNGLVAEVGIIPNERVLHVPEMSGAHVNAAQRRTANQTDDHLAEKTVRFREEGNGINRHPGADHRAVSDDARMWIHGI